eukprot:733969-Hanusia_phi.AAC.2
MKRVEAAVGSKTMFGDVLVHVALDFLLLVVLLSSLESTSLASAFRLPSPTGSPRPPSPTSVSPALPLPQQAVTF